VRRLSQAQLAISVVTIAEIRVGLVAATISERTRQEAENRLATFTQIPLDMDVVDEWARLMSDCRTGGLGEPKHNDAWIAATAIVRDLPLVSCELSQCRLPRVDPVYLKSGPDSGDV